MSSPYSFGGSGIVGRRQFKPQEAAVEFFNLKTKQKVQIPDHELKKRRSVRTTSGGKRQERFAVIAEVREHGGGKPLQLFKFVNKETFDGLDVPEVN
jgi:hypothetical protein